MMRRLLILEKCWKLYHLISLVYCSLKIKKGGGIYALLFLGGNLKMCPVYCFKPII